MGKAETVHFPFAIVRYDLKTQSASIPFDFNNVRSFSDLGKGHLLEMFYFLSETTRPGYNADHHFVILCLQKISKLVAKQMSKKLISQ